MGNKNQDTEANYYTEIINFFETPESDHDKIEIWRSQQLIKLMDDLKHNRKTKKIVINSIIIINALLEEIPADSFHSQGECIEDLTLKEKNEFKSQLERELLIA